MYHTAVIIKYTCGTGMIDYDMWVNDYGCPLHRKKTSNIFAV
jgi:hypothetical protein